MPKTKVTYSPLLWRLPEPLPAWAIPALLKPLDAVAITRERRDA